MLNYITFFRANYLESLDFSINNSNFIRTLAISVFLLYTSALISSIVYQYIFFLISIAEQILSHSPFSEIFISGNSNDHCELVSVIVLYRPSFNFGISGSDWVQGVLRCLTRGRVSLMGRNHSEYIANIHSFNLMG